MRPLSITPKLLLVQTGVAMVQSSELSSNLQGHTNEALATFDVNLFQIGTHQEDLGNSSCEPW